MTERMHPYRAFLLLGLAFALPGCCVSPNCDSAPMHSGAWSAACYRTQWGVMGMPDGTPHQWAMSVPPSTPGPVYEETLREPRKSAPRVRDRERARDRTPPREEPKEEKAPPPTMKEEKTEEFPMPEDPKDLPPTKNPKS